MTVASSLPTGKLLYLDCFSGLAGDMFMGALVDLGLPFDWLEAELARLPLQGFRLERGRREHHGIVGTDIQVHVAAGPVDYGADPGPLHDPDGRLLLELIEALSGVGFPAGAVLRAREMLERIGVALGRLGDLPLGQVRLSGPGLVDTLVDVMAAALLLDRLGPKEVVSRPVPLGQGRPHRRSASPIPAPLALELLRGAPIESGAAEIELCTPTGAAIVAANVTRFSPLPRGRILGVGYGAGDHALVDRPNHLRVLLLDPLA